jgi:hypothetical protein
MTELDLNRHNVLVDPTRGLRPLAPSGKARRGPHSPAAPLGAGSRFALRGGLGAPRSEGPS